MEEQIWMTNFLLSNEQQKITAIREVHAKKNIELFKTIEFHLERRGQSYLLKAI